MAGVRWQDRVASEEVAERLSVKEMEVRFRQGRLCWFGYVRMSEDNKVKVVENMEAGGRKPAGRPKKTRTKCIQQEINLLRVNDKLVQDRRVWRRVTTCPVPL